MNEWEALCAVAEAARPFLNLEKAAGPYADAYHIATDATGKNSIGGNLKAALKQLDKVRKTAHNTPRR